jgi:hypothetical protein
VQLTFFRCWKKTGTITVLDFGTGCSLPRAVFPGYRHSWFSQLLQIFAQMSPYLKFHLHIPMSDKKIHSFLAAFFLEICFKVSKLQYSPLLD